MPASRSAAATTFAPRSWPSRPGLPTSTRILRGIESSRLGWERSFAPDYSRRAERAPRRAGPQAVPGARLLFVRVQRPHGLLVDAPRLVEIRGARWLRLAILVEARAHDPASQEIERRVGGLLGLEEPRAIVTV